MKSIVVGGTGFIGSALVSELVSRGDQVVCIGRNVPEGKIEGAEYHALDLRDAPRDLPRVLEKGSDIFLLTGQTHAGFVAQEELELFESLLGVIREAQPSKVIFTSSALVYGECEIPATEDRILEPKDTYSVFKVACEKMLQEKLSETLVGIARLSNVYGSRKNRGFVGLVMTALSEGRMLRVNGDGLQERDYIFLDDVVQALLAFRDGLKKSDTANIATGKSSTLLDVIRCSEKISERTLQYEISGIPVPEVQKSRISNRHLKEQYGFVASYGLEEGLRRVWDRSQKD